MFSVGLSIDDPLELSELFTAGRTFHATRNCILPMSDPPHFVMPVGGAHLDGIHRGGRYVERRSLDLSERTPWNS